MAMGTCPGQIPIPYVPPTLMATATMVRACRYIVSSYDIFEWVCFLCEVTCD